MSRSSTEEDGVDQLVRAAATRLYAGAPADFVRTRTAAAKQARSAGARDAAAAITGLRKPSVTAWLLNQLVHADAPVLSELADLGARLRHAQSRLDAAAITGMRAERDTVLAQLVAAARDVAAGAGQQLTPATEAEVRDTGVAALADEAAEQVLRSGTMTRALAYSGFGEVDLAQSAATTSTGVVLTSIRGGRTDGAPVPEEADEEPDAEESDEEPDPAEADEEPAEEPDGAAALAEAAAREEHERRLEQAQQTLEHATREAGRRRASLEAARNRTEATRGRVRSLEGQLAELQTRLDRARDEDREALTQLTTAAQAADRAEQDLQEAQETLRELQQ